MPLLINILKGSHKNGNYNLELYVIFKQKLQRMDEKTSYKNKSKVTDKSQGINVSHQVKPVII